MTIVAKEFPNKTFANKQELFDALKKHEHTIIASKCAEVLKSCDKGYDHSAFFSAEKLGDFDVKASLNMSNDNIYPVINTTKYLDSHGDVHMDGIWNQSVKQQQGKLYYVADHELKVNSIIAYPQDVKVMVKQVPWGLVGKSYDGHTEALIYEIPKNKIKHDGAKQAIEEKAPMQNSVRMQYIKIKLALNSEAKEDAEYKKVYDSVIGYIANKDVAEQEGYFWAVYEAKIVREGSMVPFGSNDATPILSNEPTKVTLDKTEPQTSTQSEFYQNIIKNLKN